MAHLLQHRDEVDNFARPGAVHGLPKRTRHLLPRFRVHAMEALFDELGDVLLHAKPTAVFRQPLEGGHSTTMVSLLHVSTHHQRHLKLFSSARNPKHRAPINLEPKESLAIQGDLTIVRHKRRSPRSERAQIGTGRLPCVPNRLIRRKSFIGLACGIHCGRTNTHRRNSHSPREQTPPSNYGLQLCMIV